MKTETETTEAGINKRLIGSGMARWRSSRAWQKFRNGLALVLLVSAPCIAIATQLNLATSPLFLTLISKPNIVFLADDSASMDYGMITSDDAGIMTVGSCSGEDYTYRYTHPGAGGSATPPASNDGADQYIVPTEGELSARGATSPYGGVWRAWNKDYNKLYYNPDVTYAPWEGADSTGANYSNVSPTAAPYNPYRPSHGTIDLTGTVSYTTRYCFNGSALAGVNVTLFPARYYVWGGSGSTVAASDSHTLYEIRSSGCSTGATCPTTFTHGSGRTDCTSCTVAQELQNFANWFSYHRKRDLTMKAAVGKVVGPSSDRMAYAVLNNSAVNVSILAMNASTTSGNKRTLLNGLYSTQPTGASTPLRTQLDAVGKYFECVSGNIFGASGANCPIQDAASGGACQQNFTVAVTDGAWNDTFSGIGNADGDASSDYDNRSPNVAYGDGYSDTLADIAMHYYERDLAPGLSDQVPKVSTTDNATHQHMVTYALAFGISGALNAGPSSPTQTSFIWPAVAANTSTTIDDLRHAAYNGRGEFLSASSPDTLKTALTNAVTVGIGGKTGSSAAVAVNSRSLSTSTRLYQARFTSGDWSGDLRALSIDGEGAVNTASPVWSAKEQLKTQDWNATGGRVILTRGSTQGVAFRWTAMNTSQQSDLNTDPATSTADTKGETRLNWLRGDTSNEGTGNNFRARADGFKLGDIVNSTPVFVGTPPNLPDLETVKHSDFRKAYTTTYPRTEMIYVGANDGMLHGFNATTGQEKIAYVPSMVFSKLNQLPYTSYTHKFYMDGTPTVGDAYAIFPKPTSSADTCPGAACWRTVLVSGLGGGGKGVFALDVTDPGGAQITGLAFNDGNAANIALWELNATNDPDMGYVYGQPTIAKVRNDSSSPTKNSWVAIFGNGYNSASEKAVLYIVNIKDGGAIKGSDVKKITLDSGPSNGLSTPAVVDEDGDYVADTVYAGDLQGNLWKIDISNKNPDIWDPPAAQSPLFKAVDGTTTSTVIQPIMARPEVGPHPTGDGRMVYFGTGRYVDSSDSSPRTNPVNTFYGIWDRDKDKIQPTRATLLKQTISAVTSTFGSTTATVRQVTNRTINWCTSKTIGSCTCADSDTDPTCLGWRDDLLTTASDSLGEMAVSNPVLLGGVLPRIIFTTLIPQSEACSYGGTSWLMELNPNNGGRLSEAVFDISGNGTIGSEDKIGGTTMVSGINPGIGIMPEPVILRDPANHQDLKTEPGSTGAIQTIKNYVSGTQGGRQSWRQLK
ncbi:MAG: hypothetical protein HZA69_04290 [Gammaproteobacteria bacterium]|nr:hypothetical protein [Gammaproteobacteria bacterium]